MEKLNALFFAVTATGERPSGVSLLRVHLRFVLQQPCVECHAWLLKQSWMHNFKLQLVADKA
jgi:hypothetical protein